MVDYREIEMYNTIETQNLDMLLEQRDFVKSHRDAIVQMYTELVDDICAID